MMAKPVKTFDPVLNKMCCFQDKPVKAKTHYQTIICLWTSLETMKLKSVSCTLHVSMDTIFPNHLTHEKFALTKLSRYL